MAWGGCAVALVRPQAGRNQRESPDLGAQRNAWNSIYYQKQSIQKHLELLWAQVMLGEILGASLSILVCALKEGLEQEYGKH